jgi:hypothetical protein
MCLKTLLKDLEEAGWDSWKIFSRDFHPVEKL